ncbi:hypothetical protein ACFSJ1_28270 [Trinickia caryophylli]|uniref:hypothetical protein n=1 Tax=Trinickia caryophylli TaxID=28094 RepID=UPI003634CD44
MVVQDHAWGTRLSIDRGRTWRNVDMGWTLPSTKWLADAAVWFTTSNINWMAAQEVDWWKQPVPNSRATTWMWFNSQGESAGLPFRMMYGAPPASPYKGDPRQLAVFQNFSFIYFPSFRATATPDVDTWSPPDIPGFQFGNPENYKLVVWNEHFQMSSLMTPIDSTSFPLPTFVRYQWAADDRYKVVTDRAQCTQMSYSYNHQAGIDTQVALLYGVAPSGIDAPPFAGNGYIYNSKGGEITKCQNIGLGQQPPDWARIPGVKGTIHAVVTNHPTLCPNEVVTIISVLFPPTAEYPQGRYLWTWYSPFPGSDGTHSRPVTFMESAAEIDVGTSLALADYFAYGEFSGSINPAVFALPLLCKTQQPLAQARRPIS